MTAPKHDVTDRRSASASSANTHAGLRGGHLFVDCAAIFLSVLLAFLVEQWREDRNERQEAAAALSLVRAELSQNLAELMRVAPSREVMLQGFLAAIDTQKAVRRNVDFLDARNAQVRFIDGEQYLSGFIHYINRASVNEPNAIDDVQAALDLLDR